MKNFRLQSLLIFITLVCVVLAWMDATRGRRNALRLSEELVARELLRIHAIEFEQDSAARSYLNTFLDGVGSQGTIEFLSNGGALGSEAVSSQHEKLFETWNKQASKDVKSFANSSDIIYSPVFASKTCTAICHVEFKPGALMRIARVNLAE